MGNYCDCGRRKAEATSMPCDGLAAHNVHKTPPLIVEHSSLGDELLHVSTVLSPQASQECFSGAAEVSTLGNGEA